MKNKKNKVKNIIFLYLNKKKYINSIYFIIKTNNGKNVIRKTIICQKKVYYKQKQTQISTNNKIWNKKN